MIEEDYVSFETAKLLKEKGFDAECDYFYVDGELVRAQGCAYNWNKGETLFTDYKNECSAPTFQLVMKWLREVHHIFIDIDYDPHEFGDKPYFTLITNMDTCSYYSGKHLPVNRATYEEMAEAAIKYCLKNLI